MARKSVNWYVVKANRLSAWALLAVMGLYFVTGFALCGRFGVSEWFDPEQAYRLHSDWTWPLLALFLVHTLLSVYLAFRRWGWLGRKGKAAAGE